MKEKTESEAVTFKPITSLEEAESFMSLLISTEGQIDANNAKVESLIGDALSKIAPSTAKLEDAALNIRRLLTTFARNNQDNASFFPQGEKTLKLLSGSISINAGQPSIKILEDYDEKTVLLKIKEKGFEGLTRTPEPELSKEAVMAQLAEGKLKPMDLTAIGLKRHQETKYEVKPLTLDQAKKAYEKRKVAEAKAAAKSAVPA